MADCAERLSGMSTKPKPRGEPVSRSVMILILSTAPYGSKSWRTSCSVALNARLPTKIFTRVSSKEKAWKRSPGHPNSVQKQKTQEQYAGEEAREPRNHKLCLMVS